MVHLTGVAHEQGEETASRMGWESEGWFPPGECSRSDYVDFIPEGTGTDEDKIITSLIIKVMKSRGIST